MTLFGEDPVSDAPRYDENMLIRDVLVSHPDATAVFERHGLPCASCLASSAEKLGSIAAMHEVSVSALLSDLNELKHADAEGVAK